jgi:hypothetical protein
LSGHTVKSERRSFISLGLFSSRGAAAIGRSSAVNQGQKKEAWKSQGILQVGLVEIQSKQTVIDEAAE